MNYLIVGLGGVLGANLRYLMTTLFIDESVFPIDTFIINTMGAFLFGLLFHYFHQRKSSRLALMIKTGILSSFTTFSTFSIEVVQLFDGQFKIAIVYILSSIICSLAAFICGMKVMR
ncbi:MAG TPA: fluoride efflux transporter CrcB [Pseudogracilibacillus sp.]|nr:fluoride efflux transporter CrcB [Pseudogracilibacillus sp.]